jgi:hypothetical protein
VGEITETGGRFGPKQGGAFPRNQRADSAEICSVSKPEAVLAALLGVPRVAAMGVAEAYLSENGPLKSDQSGRFRNALEQGDLKFWEKLSQTRVYKGELMLGISAQCGEKLRGCCKLNIYGFRKENFFVPES